MYWDVKIKNVFSIDTCVFVKFYVCLYFFTLNKEDLDLDIKFFNLKM